MTWHLPILAEQRIKGMLDHALASNRSISIQVFIEQDQAGIVRVKIRPPEEQYPEGLDEKRAGRADSTRS